jgi:16S rRNA (guanine527-N7)-methyltransferase
MAERKAAMSQPSETAVPSTSLEEALRRNEIDLPHDQIARIDQYRRVLWEWNEKLNLTRHTDFDKFVSRDVVDSVHSASLLEAGETVLDVGSGGGVPGVILAILRPDVKVTLSESVGKKAEALRAIVEQLQLDAPVLAQRAEQVLQTRAFDVVIARAVGPMEKILQWLSAHWDRVGRLLLIKGPKWPEERGAARHRGLLRDLELRKAAEYPMPGTNSQSVILKLWPKARGEHLPARKKRP